MAVYVPQARRRQRLLIVALAALVVGVALGVLAGRLTAPTVREQVATAQQQARELTSQLRVLSLHAEAGAASLGSGGDGGAGLALRRATGDLDTALADAPWIPPAQGNALRERLARLSATAGAGSTSAGFATDVDHLAADLDATFGTR